MMGPFHVLDHLGKTSIKLECWEDSSSICKKCSECSCSSLLTRDSSRRLGGGGRGAEEVKCHPWLKSLDWSEVVRGELVPPLVPDLHHAGDGTQYPDYGEEMWWDVHEVTAADRDRFRGF